MRAHKERLGLPTDKGFGHRVILCIPVKEWALILLKGALHNDGYSGHLLEWFVCVCEREILFAYYM